MRSLKLLLLLVAASVSVAAFGQLPAEELAGRYSNLRVSQDSGETVGVELVVLRGGGGMSVVVRGAEDAAAVPLVVRLDVRGNDVEFAVPASCACGLQAGRYRGTVSEAGITLSGPSSFGQRFLPRSGYLQER